MNKLWLHSAVVRSNQKIKIALHLFRHTLFLCHTTADMLSSTNRQLSISERSKLKQRRQNDRLGPQLC